MSLGLSLTTRVERVAGDPAAAARLAAALRPQALHPVIGRSGVNTIREHLFGLNASRPNKLGGRRTNFYADAARGTSSTAVDEGAVVSVAQVGMRQRFKGGTIRAKPGKWLTIPARAEAHGKRAREFNDLRFVIFKDGPGAGAALVRNDSTALKRKRDRKTGAVSFVAGESRGGEVMYWLKRSVTQRADPTVLPADELVAARLDRDVLAFIDRRTASAPGAKS